MKLKRLSYVIFLIGLSVFMYPHITKIVFHTENNIEFNSYEEIVSQMDDVQIQEEIEVLMQYNEDLVTINTPTQEGESSSKEYIDPFIGGVKTQSPDVKMTMKNGVFGYIRIPKINETLPIYLGASLENLAKGVAQIEETSLPVGGQGTNSVIAGHRGYNQGKAIFKYLDKLTVGDRFYIHIYDRILTYQVFKTEVIMPNQTEKLNIDPDKDMVTLLTCTPYRVSTQRLLVYAERVMTESSQGKIEFVSQDENTISQVLSASKEIEEGVSSSVQQDQMISYVVVGVGGILWIFTFALLIKSFFNKDDKKTETERTTE